MKEKAQDTRLNNPSDFDANDVTNNNLSSLYDNNPNDINFEERVNRVAKKIDKQLSKEQRNEDKKKNVKKKIHNKKQKLKKEKDSDEDIDANVFDAEQNDIQLNNNQSESAAENEGYDNNIIQEANSDETVNAEIEDTSNYYSEEELNVQLEDFKQETVEDLEETFSSITEIVSRKIAKKYLYKFTRTQYKKELKMLKGEIINKLTQGVKIEIKRVDKRKLNPKQAEQLYKELKKKMWQVAKVQIRDLVEKGLQERFVGRTSNYNVEQQRYRLQESIAYTFRPKLNKILDEACAKDIAKIEKRIEKEKIAEEARLERERIAQEERLERERIEQEELRQQELIRRAEEEEAERLRREEEERIKQEEHEKLVAEKQAEMEAKLNVKKKIREEKEQKRLAAQQRKEELREQERQKREERLRQQAEERAERERQLALEREEQAQRLEQERLEREAELERQRQEEEDARQLQEFVDAISVEIQQTQPVIVKELYKYALSLSKAALKTPLNKRLLQIEDETQLVNALDKTRDKLLDSINNELYKNYNHFVTKNIPSEAKSEDYGYLFEEQIQALNAEIEREIQESIMASLSEQIEKDLGVKYQIEKLAIRTPPPRPNA